MDKQANRWTDRGTEYRQMNRRRMDGQTDGRMDRQTDGLTDW